MFAAEATKPFGDAEFFFAKATDNPYLAPGYVEQTLEALPAHLRRRYLDGIWEFISGSCYFDEEALTFYDEVITQPKYLGETEGSVPVGKKRIRIKVRRNGPVAVWEPPVRGRKDPEGRVLPAHRYVLAVDAAAGGPKGDFAAIQVVSIEDFAQVAEYQAKVEPNQLAVEAYRLGKIYNEALIVPELTGGWGFAVTSELERLGYRNIYTKRVEDRLKKIWTDKLGWDTTAKSRADMLDTLERVIREREFKLRGHRTLTELKTFVWPDKRQSEGPYKGIPQAQSGCHDDLVMALAIAVQVALSRPRQLRKPKPDRYQPQFAATGY